MRLGSYEIEHPLVLGPMAGVTDWAFRNICNQMGANITVTEMVSSRALVYRDKKSAALLKRTSGGLCGAQIFGNDPTIMAEGARLALEISGADFLDINMGCPMPKIANSGDGCGLMRTPELAEEIVKAVVDSKPCKKSTEIFVTAVLCCRAVYRYAGQIRTGKGNHKRF